MPRGGARTGAGRKLGSLTKRTREIAEASAAEGMTPLEYMLAVMRDESETDERRLDAAKAAAPYVHPRLSSVDVTSKGESVQRLISDRPMTEAEWQNSIGTGQVQ